MYQRFMPLNEMLIAPWKKILQKYIFFKYLFRMFNSLELF